MRATLPLVSSPLVGGFCLLMPSLPFFLALLDAAPPPGRCPPPLRCLPPLGDGPLFLTSFDAAPLPRCLFLLTPPLSCGLPTPHLGLADLGFGLGSRVRVGLGLRLGLLVVWSQSGPPQAVRLSPSQLPTACPNPVGVLVGAASVVRI